ncbi:MAG TPA: PDZ domain-containing protein [Planctomycetota bacterium]|nr:PDZ domain-containing protein [Planctomycetota bacterium]
MTATRNLLLLLLLALAAPLAAQSDQPWLGLRLRVIEKEEREKLRIESGLLVTQVNEGSPAEAAGIEVGDVVLSAGEKSVNSIEDMQAVLANKKPGDTLGLGIRHKDGKIEPMMVTLARKGGGDEEFKDDVRARELREAIEKKRKELRDLEEDLRKRLDDLRSGRAKTESRPTPAPEPKVEKPESAEPKSETREPERTEVKVKLGASFADVALADARKLGIEAGITASKITTGSAAAKAGLKEGDVVYEVGGEKVTGTGHLRTLLAKYNPGDKVEFKVLRNGKKESVTITLEAR